MAGFKKAVLKQAFVKMAMYGPAGSGKSFTALLLGEGIAKATGRRIAYVDTELGTQFYSERVADRAVHPDAFDFDRLDTRSITEVNKSLRDLDPKVYGIVVVDSLTHLWEACKASYNGKLGPNGQIPMWAWQKIKAPWKEMMAFVVNSPFHVIAIGRQGNDFTEDEDGQVKANGVKMKAEGETQYEPHVCLRMESVKANTGKGQKQLYTPVAHIEKDRLGPLQGKTIEWPTFDNLCKPLMGLLGKEHASAPSDAEAAAQDSEALSKAASEKVRRSHDLANKYVARFQLCESTADADALSKELTPTVKKDFLAPDLERVRSAYSDITHKLKGQVPVGAGANGQIGDEPE